MKTVATEDVEDLLEDGEVIPPAVRRCADCISRLTVWCLFSKNDTALGCQDAARRRNRLGHRGIPLWDELKSFLGQYKDADGNDVLFLAHCRGDRELDFDKVLQALGTGSDIQRVDPEYSGVQFGTVNPFQHLPNGAVQLFDHELHRPLGVPGTVMTNCGDLTWAVEFDPAEVVVKLPNARWADLTQDRTERDTTLWGIRSPETIGILTGNPSDSGLELCAAINTHVRDLLGRNSLGDVSMPKVVMIASPAVGISMEMDHREEALRKALAKSTDELCEAGGRLLVHPAHTTHYFAAEIAERAVKHGARFISMIDATVASLRQMGIGEIALLGTRYVTDFTLPWSAYGDALRDLTVHVPSEEGWKKIHNLGYEVQQKGPTSLCFNWMRDLLREEVPPTCTHVLLAMTEFTPVVRQLKARGKQGKILIDPIEIYAEHIARVYLGLAE